MMRIRVRMSIWRMKMMMVMRRRRMIKMMI